MAFWRTKAAMSLKRVNIEEKLLWRAYRNSSTLFQTVPSPAPYGLPVLKIGVCNLATPLIPGTGISGTDKATDFKFCSNIHRVDPNKS